MTTWIDAAAPSKLAPAMARYLADPGAQRARDYAGVDDRFGLWLRLVEVRAERWCGVSVFDLPDWAFRDAYDGGASPKEAAREMLTEEGWL